jgi:hypothetical protein
VKRVLITVVMIDYSLTVAAHIARILLIGDSGFGFSHGRGL